MKKLSLTIVMLLAFATIGLAQKKTSRLAECRKQLNEINAMELRQVEACGAGFGFAYFDESGLIRKYINQEINEMEHFFLVCYYNKLGSAIYIAHQSGNTVTDENGFAYLDKDEIILQNSFTNPYYEEFYVNGELTIEGEKGGFTTKGEGSFLYETPLYNMNLNKYAHVDSLRKYCNNEYGYTIELSENATTVNFDNFDLAYVTFYDDNSIVVRKTPKHPSSPAVDHPVYLGFPLKVLEKCEGEIVDSWDFNHWYKVEYGDVIGYIYGAFLEPVKSFP